MVTPHIEIPVLEGDDVDFIHLARTAIADEVKIASREIYLVKIDQWFGKNWLRFSGKVMGAFGIKKWRLTPPPFHPSRVVFERHFTIEPGAKAYVEDEALRPLHIHQTSEENRRRYIDDVTESGTFVWYSGDTQKSGRGSMMVYVISADERSEWYVELIRDRSAWRMSKPIHMIYPESHDARTDSK
jgi:hypothetical protein